VRFDHLAIDVAQLPVGQGDELGMSGMAHTIQTVVAIVAIGPIGLTIGDRPPQRLLGLVNVLGISHKFSTQL
jgi:hypothetical protein